MNLIHESHRSSSSSFTDLPSASFVRSKLPRWDPSNSSRSIKKKTQWLTKRHDPSIQVPSNLQPQNISSAGIRAMVVKTYDALLSNDWKWSACENQDFVSNYNWVCFKLHFSLFESYLLEFLSSPLVYLALKFLGVMFIILFWHAQVKRSL